MTTDPTMTGRHRNPADCVVAAATSVLLLVLIAGAFGMRQRFVANGLLWSSVSGGGRLEKYWYFYLRNGDLEFAVMSDDRSSHGDDQLLLGEFHLAAEKSGWTSSP